MHGRARAAPCPVKPSREILRSPADTPSMDLAMQTIPQSWMISNSIPDFRGASMTRLLAE